MPKEAQGQSLVEYLLLLSTFLLISALCLQLFGPHLHDAWAAIGHFFSLPSP
jgi:hypothetical protein